MGERRWLVIASDGRHVTIGRTTDPTPEALEEAGERLRALGLAGWLAVSDGDYHGPGRLDLLLVRPLFELPGTAWDEARAAFFAARQRARRDAP